MAESPYIERNRNVLHFQSLSNPFVVGNFIRAVYKGRERGFKDFVLDCGAVSGTFPNVCVPIAGLLDVYRDDGVEFSKTRVPEFLENTRLFNPAIVPDNPPGSTRTIAARFRRIDDRSIIREHGA